MEKEILNALSSLLDEKLEPIKVELKEINRKIDGVVEQTADLLEFRSGLTEDINIIKNDVEEIKKDMYRVEEATANNWADIAKLKAVK